MAIARRNPELPGVERPSMRVLDEVFAPLLDKRDTRKALEKSSAKAIKDAKSTEEVARSSATERMVQLAEKLPVDVNGNPTYVYHDGARTVRLSLKRSTELLIEDMTEEGEGTEGAEGTAPKQDIG